MATEAESLSTEQAKDDLIIERKLAEAIHASLYAVIDEALPDQMALLLVQLALAQTVVAQPETELERVIRNLAKAKLIVAGQCARLAELQAESRPTEDAIELLSTFLQSVAVLEHRYRLLREKAEGKDRNPRWLFSRFAAAASAKFV